MHSFMPSFPRPSSSRRLDSGASTLEYALLAAAVAAVLVAVLIGVGSIVQDAIERSDSCVTSQGTSATCPTR
jgi:Flp pilus assembly pilin Flp